MTAMSRGIDVSAYQSKQDWKKLKAEGLTFAFAKASEGQTSRDGDFAMHITGIKAADLVPGAYHFAWPNQNVAREAANYITAVKPYAGKGFLHWLDLERYTDGRNYRGRSDAQITAWAKKWIELVQKAFPGQRVGIYTSGDDIAKGHAPASAPLWYPAYPGQRVDTFAEAEAASRPTPSGRKPLIWQFTSTPAKGPRVDSNLCYLSPADLREWAKGGTTTPTTPTTPPKPSHPAAPAFPGAKYFVLGAKNSYAKQLQTWLHKGNWGPKYLIGPSSKMTAKDLKKVKALQQHYLSKLGPADGIVGPLTWQYAYEVANGYRSK
jgi:GH25 family lysozyme M1 (1,4-beta-N-acetylmuramidase)